ncbi:Anaphase-promoting complex subunit 23 [Actinomortierella ambigua]|nr:Anaphase-promoting complex subunit 23 [Actinomortierella ambigua]
MSSAERSLPDWSMPSHEARGALREAIQACNERGLYFAAKWAAEALNGLPRIDQLETRTTRSAIAASIGQTYVSKWTEELSMGTPLDSIELVLEMDTYLMAKTLFDLKEYDRVASTLTGCKSHKSIFLRLYSKYLAGERRREQEARDVMGPMDTSMVINRELDKIDAELSEMYQSGTMDSFCKYLYAIVLTKRNRKQHAATVLVESVRQYPYNWSTWLQLTELPVNFMREMFLLHVGMETFNGEEEFETRLEELYQTFPRSAYMKEQRALALYHAREFPASQEIFEELTKENPHRLDNLDVFSNLLYVTDNRTKLSFLAHSCSHTDNFRPETCLVIGNYYAMRNDHEKAVVYFKRALRLDRGYAAAWTLLGHEYLEMKNTYAAIEAYRRAVDYNHRDYRAWNGLGQTYEVLKMHYYALGYYQRATALRPYDGRLWCAMAECYESLSQDLAAIKCYTRALLGADKEKVALRKLPKLYKKIGNTEAAAHYFRKSYEQRREEDEDSEDASEACIFLAMYERTKGNWQRAHDYAAEAMNLSSGQYQEEARALLRDIRSIQALLLISLCAAVSRAEYAAHEHVAQQNLQPHKGANAADLLAGPLEGARWGKPFNELYAAEHEKLDEKGKNDDDFTDDRPNNKQRPYLGDPQQAFLAPDFEALATTIPAPFEFHMPPNPDGSPGDCSSKQDLVIQLGSAVNTMIYEVAQAHPALKALMDDLALVLKSLPAKDAALEELVARYRTTEYGLLGFEHLYPYMPNMGQKIVKPVIDATLPVEAALKDVLGCLTGNTFSDRSSMTSARVVRGPECGVAQSFYDTLLKAATELASRIHVSYPNRERIKVALEKLQFQSAGAYLSDQGAYESIGLISIKDGVQSELEDLVMSLHLALAAGDALQACQHSRLLRAIEEEASELGVHHYEQDIYDRLGMYSRARDPAGRGGLSSPSPLLPAEQQPAKAPAADDSMSSQSLSPAINSAVRTVQYSGCELAYQSLVEALHSALQMTVSSPLQSQTAFKMTDEVLVRFFERTLRRITTSSGRGELDVELRQLDIALAQLIQTIKRAPSDHPYEAMKRFSDPLNLIEDHIFQLHACVMNITPEIFSSSDTSSRKTMLGCNVIAELYLSILQETLNELDELVQDQDNTQMDSEAINLFRSRVILLARTANLWDEDTIDLVEDIDSNPSWRGMTRSQVSSLIDDDFIAQLQAYLTDDNNDVASFADIVEFIPLIRTGATMLEACDNVQRQFSGVDPAMTSDIDHMAVGIERGMDQIMVSRYQASMEASSLEHFGFTVTANSSQFNGPTPPFDEPASMMTTTSPAASLPTTDEITTTEDTSAATPTKVSLTSEEYTTATATEAGSLPTEVAIISASSGYATTPSATTARHVIFVEFSTTAAPTPISTEVACEPDCIQEMLTLGDSIMAFRALVAHLHEMDESSYNNLNWGVVALERISHSLIEHGAKYIRLYLGAIWTIFRSILTLLENNLGEFANQGEYNSVLRLLMSMVQSSHAAKLCFETALPPRTYNKIEEANLKFQRNPHQRFRGGRGDGDGHSDESGSVFATSAMDHSGHAISESETEQDYFHEDMNDAEKMVERLEKQPMQGKVKDFTDEQIRQKLDDWKTLQEHAPMEDGSCSRLGSHGGRSCTIESATLETCIDRSQNPAKKMPSPASQREREGAIESTLRPCKDVSGRNLR